MSSNLKFVSIKAIRQAQIKARDCNINVKNFNSLNKLSSTLSYITIN